MEKLPPIDPTMGISMLVILTVFLLFSVAVLVRLVTNSENFLRRMSKGRFAMGIIFWVTTTLVLFLLIYFVVYQLLME